MRSSTLPPTSGMLTFTARSICCTTSSPDWVSDVEPVMSPGLPGIVTWMSAADGDDHVSSWTNRISWPTSLCANDGIRSVPCACSSRTVIPPP